MPQGTQNIKVMKVVFPDGDRAIQINDGDEPLCWIDDLDGLMGKLQEVRRPDVAVVHVGPGGEVLDD